jgi:DNA-nicking Smr family endonuclease
MGKKSKHSNSDEAALFRDAIGDVKPVSSRRQLPEKRQPMPHPRFSEADEQDALAESLLMDPDPALMETGEELLFNRPHINRITMRALRRGKFAIEDEIDLHRMTRDQAGPALRGFIRDCHAHGIGCVRVVHGKGLGSGPRGPVLKAAVSRWLSRWDEVAAFCSTLPRHGGTGAVYVLLTKKK